MDHYQKEGVRDALFLNENVLKYHRTIATYMNDLIDSGFIIGTVKESFPSDGMVKNDPQMEDENRRPMFLLIAASK